MKVRKHVAFTARKVFELLKVKPVWNFNKGKIRLSCSDRHGIAGKCDVRLFYFRVDCAVRTLSFTVKVPVAHLVRLHLRFNSGRTTKRLTLRHACSRIGIQEYKSRHNCKFATSSNVKRTSKNQIFIILDLIGLGIEPQTSRTDNVCAKQLS